MKRIYEWIGKTENVLFVMGILSLLAHEFVAAAIYISASFVLRDVKAAKWSLRITKEEK